MSTLVDQRMSFATWRSRARRSGRRGATATFAALSLIATFRGTVFIAPQEGSRQTATSRREVLLGSAGGAVVTGASPAQASTGSQLFGVDFSFLDPAAPESYQKPPKDAEFTESGLASKVLLRPTCALSKSSTKEMLAACPHPQPFDKVLIDYTGWQSSNGKMFDSSRLEKATVRVNDVIKGWTEGLRLMSPGEKRRFWIPADLAYGENVTNDRPSGMLVFDVDLYSIDKQPEPPATPQDIAAAPADATLTESGSSYKVLVKGTGMAKPLNTSKITAAYSGWKSNGQLIMSTLFDAPKEFVVQDVPIKGLADAFKNMVEGEKRRWWIPVKQASTGKAAGILVFDAELLKIESVAKL